MDNFPLNARYRDMVLRTAADIVQHSFIVQDSISPLNLELSQSYIVLYKDTTTNNLPPFSYSKDFINSEEKCRKVFTSGRSLLYTLHLDIPKDKEPSLKSEWISNKDSLHCRKRESHIAAICIEDNFYIKILSSHIDYACKLPDQSLRVLKWFINNILRESDVTCLPANILNHIADCMHPELYDSEFLKGCSVKLNSPLANFLFTGEDFKLGKRINFICQLYRTGRMPETRVWFEANTSPASGDLDKYMRQESSIYTNSRPTRRHCLLLQVLTFYLYNSKDPQVASEFLRVAWSSIPDTFLSSSEITAAIGKTVCSATVADICNFYSKAVSELNPYVEPRSLQHYCRTLIRRKLNGKTKWIPDGIKELGLPKTIQSYLDLYN